MKKFFLLGFVVSTITIQSVCAKELQREWIAEEGSTFAKYEELANTLDEIEDVDEIKESSTYILKDYFGFDEVVFASNLFWDKKRKEATMAKFVAQNMRQILPAHMERQYFLKVNKETVSTKFIDKDLFRHGKSNGFHRRYILIFNADVDGVDFSVDVSTGKQIPENDRPPMGNQTHYRVETYTLTIGGKRILLHTGRIKPFMSLLLNFPSQYFNVDFDYEPEN